VSSRALRLRCAGNACNVAAMFSHKPVVSSFLLRLALAFGTGFLIVALL
jgi:hypothetical protein